MGFHSWKLVRRKDVEAWAVAERNSNGWSSREGNDRGWRSKADLPEEERMKVEEAAGEEKRKAEQSILVKGLSMK